MNIDCPSCKIKTKFNLERSFHATKEGAYYYYCPNCGGYTLLAKESLNYKKILSYKTKTEEINKTRYIFQDCVEANPARTFSELREYLEINSSILIKTSLDKDRNIPVRELKRIQKECLSLMATEEKVWEELLKSKLNTRIGNVNAKRT